MKRGYGKVPRISEEELSIEEFYTLDTFGPHAKLKEGEFRDLVNMDIYGDYIITRRGSSKLNDDSLIVGEDVLSYVVFDGGEKEYVIVQVIQSSASSFYFIELSSSGVWDLVRDKSTSDPLTLVTTEPVEMMMSNGKIYLFSTGGNRILEFDSSSLQFQSRKMGLPGPQIIEVDSSEQDVGDPGLAGKRVYGAELIYKDTSVTPNVDMVLSGPNRAIESVNPEFNEGRLAVTEGLNIYTTVKISNVTNDGSLLTDAENDNWTHIRLLRSKDVTTATNTTPDQEGQSEITGRYDELYQVQEMDRETFLATWDGSSYSFDGDVITDDDMPFPLDIITGDRLELYPIPPASTGTFFRNRIWASGITSFPGPSGEVVLPNIESKIFFSPETYTTYAENVQALSAVESDPGDGEKMVKVLGFQEDLIGIKEGKTGKVQYGNPESGWLTVDHAIGIESKKFAQFVPNVGICAIVNDQKDFRILGYDLKWYTTFGELQISRPIRNIIKDWVREDISFMYMNGKLFLNGGDAEMLILNVEQQKGWARYRYPFNSKTEVMFAFDEGRRAGVLSEEQPLIEIEIADLETDYNPVTQLDEYVDWRIETHKWQHKRGRSIIEQRYLSIVAEFTEQISVQPYVNGRIWDVPFGMLLDPADYPYETLQETEYQGYSEIKPIGNYLHYVITGNKPATIYSIMLNCLLQVTSIAPGFDPFQILELAGRVPPWASVTNDISETGTATDEIDETGSASDNILEDS